MEPNVQNSKYHGYVSIEERLASLFEPDSLLSAQYFENLRRKTVLEPEKRLIVAVLEDAINVFQNNLTAQSGRGKKLFDEAEEWIWEQDGHWLFSFESVCEILGLNPAYVRRGLLRWKEKQLAQSRSSESWEKRRMAG
ncbi:MAG TPA: hypothetical protein VFU31_08825 [Candidatus Binatia bacterium]|nr:hypothetical protein [Candidatus Binatia bacterium]